jgi:hypothetical protein
MDGDWGGPGWRPSPRVKAALTVAPFFLVALFLLWQTRGQTFYADEWAFYVRSAGFDAERMLAPHLGNLIVGTVLVYKGVLSVAGAGNHLSLRLVWIGLDLLCAGLFFALARERVGTFAALVPALLLSVFGAAWEFFGGSLGITALLCVSTGLGALIAIERRTPWADALACLLLALSLSALSTGLAFAAGALSLLLLSTDRWRRIWVAAIPLALYGGWSLWARHYGEAGITAETVANAPASILASLASASAALFGAFREPGADEPGASNLAVFINEEPGMLLGALLVALVVWGIGRRGFERRLVPPLAMLVAYWGSLALVSPPREPNTTRYQYAAAIFILLLLTELWRGWRPSPRAKAAIAVVGLVAIVPNVANLVYATELVRSVSEQDRAKLAVVDSLRGRISPQTIIEPPGATIAAELVISVEDYLRADDAFGSPADSIGRLPEVGVLPRQAADRELVYLLEIEPVPGGGAPAATCQVYPPGEIGIGGFEAPPGGFSFQPLRGTEVTIGLRRFSDDFLRLDPVVGSGPSRLRIPADRSAQPWYAALESATPVRVCPLADPS